MTYGVIGHIDETPVQWYVLKDGRVVSFHTAITDDGDRIFFSDSDTWPSIAAESLHIKYTFMRNSTPKEVEDYLANTTAIEVEKVLEV